MRGAADEDCGQNFNVTKSKYVDSPETLSASSKDLGLITSTGKTVARDSSQNDEVSSSQVRQHPISCAGGPLRCAPRIINLFTALSL